MELLVPVDAKVISFQKRRQPSKYYTYCVDVYYDSNTSQVIYRRYSHFFSLQCKLLDAFPVESGEKDHSKLKIPLLPGKIYFSRSQVREVADARKIKLHAYCQKLFKLPDRISRHELVQEFFRPWDEDNDVADAYPSRQSSVRSTGAPNVSHPEPVDVFHVLVDFKAVDPGEISVRRNDLVQVLGKQTGGWWFVATDSGEGWVPASYLDTQDLPPVPLDNPEGEHYVCTETYRAQRYDEITLTKGQVGLVVQKNLDGWWKMEVDGQIGLVPAINVSRVDVDQ